ncbi:MAG: saccharopine dehydrogenase NADP-binding domain-containing protein [Deltaproteobacteria bacterium]|nr:saccharopine dehydrogenase NADP-binding domain-containing protein [Deltaproteobacteria bacterium]
MKNVLVLGAGLVAGPLVRYLLESGFAVTVASRTLPKAQKLIGNHPSAKARQWNSDDRDALSRLVRQTDLAISLLPYIHHPKVAELCVEHKKPMVTTSYVSEAMRKLDAPARTAGVILLNEIGVDPGIDHMSAMQIIDHVRDRGGKTVSFYSYCGGLPAPEANTNPWGYKFSWSPRGVVLAAKNGAKYLKEERVVEIAPRDLFTHTWKVAVDGAGTFDAYPNRDSLSYIETYGLDGIQTMYRGTLRNPGWCETWKTIAELNLYDNSQTYDFSNQTYGEWAFTRKRIPRESNHEVSASSWKWFEWLGLFSNEKIPLQNGTALDLLSYILEKKLKYEPGERDMLVMHHEFIAQFPDKKERITSTLVDFGIPNGDTSMSRTVGLPAAVAARLILEGKISLKGVQIPVCREIYEPVLAELKELGIAHTCHCVEEAKASSTQLLGPFCR